MKERKMRILIVSPDLHLMGGVGEVVQMLLQELEGRAEVTLKVFGRRAGQVGVKRLFSIFADIFLFAVLLCRNRFDVIHINPSFKIRSILKEIPLFILFCLFGYSGRILILIHGWDQVLFSRISSHPVLLKMIRFLFLRAGFILVLAGSFRESLLEAGIHPDKVKVISTMVDMNAVPYSRSCEGEGRTFLFLSRMIRAKGVYEIMDAFAILNRRYSGLKLIMAGDGPEREKLVELAKMQGVGNIIFPGYIKGEEKMQALAEACIFLMPTSYGEGCPVALLEAMASGQVAVVAAAGGITDVIRPGETAVLLDEISAESIVQAVSKLIDDPDLRSRLSKNARAYASDNFSSKIVTDRIAGFYEQLCGVI